MHCDHPACASVCPVFAYRKSKEGPVYYDDKRCIGCRFCMVACPFGVPKYEWSKALPLVRKCTGCYSRVKEGLVPACAKTCPSAITYGSKKDMIAEAKRRLAARPDVYVEKIYGLEDVGGTSVLYLASQPFDELGFRKVTQRAISEYTWQALRYVPGVFVGVAGTLSFVAWLSHRKERIAREAGDHAEHNDEEPGGKS
jgi:formate dehydrogenase iron-sulfur subunit